jgi:hypothetical protein
MNNLRDKVVKLLLYPSPVATGFPKELAENVTDCIMILIYKECKKVANKKGKSNEREFARTGGKDTLQRGI